MGSFGSRDLGASQGNSEVAFQNHTVRFEDVAHLACNFYSQFNLPAQILQEILEMSGILDELSETLSVRRDLAWNGTSNQNDKYLEIRLKKLRYFKPRSIFVQVR